MYECLYACVHAYMYVYILSAYACLCTPTPSASFSRARSLTHMIGDSAMDERDQRWLACRQPSGDAGVHDWCYGRQVLQGGCPHDGRGINESICPFILLFIYLSVCRRKVGEETEGAGIASLSPPMRVFTKLWIPLEAGRLHFLYLERRTVPLPRTQCAARTDCLSLRRVKFG